MISCHAESHPSKTERLKSKVYQTFTKTLRKHYQIKDEQQLYQKFLTDYWRRHQALPADTVQQHAVRIGLGAGKRKLDAVNKHLFKRDSQHFYYFYDEVVQLDPDENMDKAEELFKLHPDIPLTIRQKKKEEGDRLFSLEETPTVNLVAPSEKRGFLYDLTSQNDEQLKTISFIKNTIGELKHGATNFYMVSCWSQDNDFMAELGHKEVREFIAVVFWKFLCTQAGIEFYAPPKGQELVRKSYR